MSYHPLSKFFHWITALLIAGLVLLGLYMTPLAFSEFKLQLYIWHKSFGLLVLLLLVFRILIFVVHKKPKPLEEHKRWERMLAKCTHIFLYLLLFLMPLSGWVMSSAGDYTVQFFDIHLPDIVDKDEVLFRQSKLFHSIFAIILIFLVLFHAIGGLKHHLIDKDMTIKRITSNFFGIKSGFFLILLVFLFGYNTISLVRWDQWSKQFAREETVSEPVNKVLDSRADGTVQAWIIDLAQSKLVFSAKQYGQDFSGYFERFGGDIFFDPEQLNESRVHIEIDISSLDTGSADRDLQALSSVWFDSDPYPKAIFEAGRFEAKGDQLYIAHGFLTVRGVRMPLVLPFQLQIYDNSAHMIASFSLNRLDFDIGKGQSEQIVSHEIKFEVQVFAKKR